MASVKTSSYDGRYLELTVTQTKGTSSQNYSIINWELESIGGNDNYYTIYNYGVWIDGEQRYDGTNGTKTKAWNTKEFPAKKGSVKGSFIKYHNADGSVDDISFTLKGCVFNNQDKSYSDTLSMSPIARYFSSNPTISLVSKTETTATMKWTTSEPCSTVQYKIDDGGWVDVVADANAKSGTYTITGLSPNTSYTIYGDNKRRDSGLWAQTKPSVPVSTYNYPYINSTPNFTIGDDFTIKAYNPLGRSLQLYIIAADSSKAGGDVITGTSLSGYTSDAWKNFFYKSIPASQSGKYKVQLICNALSRNDTYDGGTYTIRKSDDEKPTFDSSYIVDIINTAHTDISGQNKFIQNHNYLTGVIKPMKTNKYATPDKYLISSSGLSTVTKAYSNSNINFELGNLSTNQFNVSAVDKRTMNRNVPKTIVLIPYNNPGVSSSTIVRQNGTGTKAIIDLVGFYTNWQNLLKQNTIKSIIYRFKEKSQSTYSNWKNLPAGYTLNVANGVWALNCTLDDDFNNTKQYDIQFEIKDLLETVIGTYTISTANALLWRDLANKRIGVNKKPTKAFDVAGDINTDGALYINNTKMIWYE